MKETAAASAQRNDLRSQSQEKGVQESCEERLGQGGRAPNKKNAENFRLGGNLSKGLPLQEDRKVIVRQGWNSETASNRSSREGNMGKKKSEK